MGACVQFKILGPFEVGIGEAEPVALGGLRQRALLAVLVLHAGEVVSTDRIIDQLWGEHPPTTAAHTVQVFVSRLRRALGEAGGRLLTRPPGYLLELDDDGLDAARCERLYGTARAALASGRPAEAAADLREALALWRGAPLAEFTYEPFAQAAIARLEELRLGCREELIDAELALGGHAKVVSELEALVREQPFRERARAQLMLALYRCGRQGDALESFQQARRALIDDLGVEPSTALRRLEQAILDQDPALDRPATATTDPVPAETPDEPARPPEPPQPPERAQPPEQARSSDPAGVVRKSVTVLVMRLGGAETDPERARSLIATAKAQARETVARHGGVYVAGLGGEAMAIFGLPRTEEDDARRALRTATELQAEGLALRIGVDSGEVVGESAADLYGEPLDGAAALAQAAAPGEVLLGDRTRKLTEPRPLPGAASITPIVGRVDELDVAHRTFARAAAERTAHLLTVIGEAGIGKSRLVAELTSELGEQAMVLSGCCLSYGDGIAFWPLREALTEAAGGDSRDAIRALFNGAPDGDLIADVVATTVGLSALEHAGEQVPWAFRRLLELLAVQRPVVLVIEDAHWAEPPLLDLLEYLIDWLVAPVLIVCATRPELLERRPGLGGGRPRVGSLVLGPLDGEDARRLLDQRLGEGQSRSTALRAQILEAAEGNPLFVEQLSASAAADPSWDRRGELPATIQSVLAARIDRLGPGERALIERAAVIGREFSQRAIVELLPARAQESAATHLRALVQRGLVQPGAAPIDGEYQLRFNHILIRDVAYIGTPKRLRSELHERFAGWLARRGEADGRGEGDGRGEVIDEFVGHHLEQAHRYRSELGDNDERTHALAGAAALRLAAAGRRALACGESNTGARLLRRSADLFQAAGEQRPDVLLDLGDALSDAGDFDAAETVLEAALAGARELGAEAVAARASIELSYRRTLVDPQTPVQEMLDVAQDAVEVFTRLDDHGGIARAWHHVGQVHWIHSHGAEMGEVLERALAHAERAGDRREQARILGGLARVTVIGPGPVADGIERCNAILERAGDDVVLTAATETMLAMLEAMHGDFERARELRSRSDRRLQGGGLAITAAVLQMYTAFIELMAGRAEAAIGPMAASHDLLARVGEGHRRTMTAAMLARLHYAEGHLEEADRYAGLGERTASRDDVGTQVLLGGTRAKLLARGDQNRAATALANRSVKAAAGTDYLMLHGEALCDRAEVHALLGGRPQAISDLDEAVAIFERKGISSLAARARELRRELAEQAALQASP